MKEILTRTSNLLSVMILAIACVATISSCQKDTDEDENGNPNLSKFFSINVTRCERVGSRIIMEYDFQNKSGKDLSNVYLNPSSLLDNNGTQYSTYNNIGMRVMGGLSRPYEVGPLNFTNGETKRLEVVAGEFDYSNTSQTVSLTIQGKINGVTLGDNTLKTSASIIDNRIMDNGIQTNDTQVSYKLNSCLVSDGTLYVSFTMTNNTGLDLKEVRTRVYTPGVPVKDYTTPSDDLGQTYRQDLFSHLTIEGSEEYKMETITDINKGTSKTYTYKLDNFDASGNAKNVSFGLYMECTNYLFSDAWVHFINIPIH